MSEQNTTQQGYPIIFDAVYAEKMSRLSTFFRIILVIPQSFVLYFLAIAASVVTFFAWWVILFTGKFPKGMWDFMAGYMRWTTRVNGYSMLLTDKYPPFSTNS
jgi:ABC-type multidrug transport system permease subunit